MVYCLSYIPGIRQAMKRINYLIYKEIWPTIIIALVVLTFISFSREFHRFAQMIITSGTSFRTFVEVILIILANVLYFTLPISLLIGTISCFSRLSSDSEVIALKACGISVFQLLRPIFVVSTIMFGLTFILTTNLAPSANNYFRSLQYEVAISQLTTEIRPRVFIDKFRDFIFYVEDLDSDTSSWKGIFLVDNSNENEPKIYLAQSGRIFVVPERQALQLHLERGLIYAVKMREPSSDSVTRFGSLDIPLTNLNITSPSQIPKRNREKSMTELSAEINGQTYRAGSDEDNNVKVEYYRRWALPFACFVLGLIGVPLGLSSRRGGRSSGFVISLFVVFSYYAIFASAWKVGTLYDLFPVRVGIWFANAIFLVFGLALLWFANRDYHHFRKIPSLPGLRLVASAVNSARKGLQTIFTRLKSLFRTRSDSASKFSFRPARVLDFYILAEFSKILVLTIVAALLLFTIFTLFELIDEIYTNHIPLGKVVEYFIFVWPMILGLVLPLCVLISILVCFGILEKTSQVTALKSCGVSIYRMSASIVILTVLCSIALFVMQEAILPYTNQRQDNLLNEIKGRTIQTYFRPEITWIMGSNSTIYHYSFFDYDRDLFANLSIFNLNLSDAKLDNRIFCPDARWNKDTNNWTLRNGWRRTFTGNGPVFESFNHLSLELPEKPSYFKTEMKRSDKMSYLELRDYISKLSRSGFETLGLEVELYKKISYPVVTLIMLFIGLPFSFKMGKKGAVYGIAVSVFIGIIFWALFNVFTAVGGNGVIPPLLAAWAPNLFFGFTGFYLVLNLRT